MQTINALAARRIAYLTAVLAMLLALFWLAPRPAYAQDAQAASAPDPNAPYLSEIAPAAGPDQPAWVEITVGRVEPGTVEVPVVSNTKLFLPAIKTGDGAAAAMNAATTDGAVAVTADLKGWALDDGDGHRYILPAGLPALPKGTVVLVRFDGAGAAGDDLDPSDKRVTLHTPAGMTGIFEAAGDQLSLYDNANKLMDFVAWGQRAGDDDDAAAAAGLWTAETYITYDAGFGAGGQASPDAPNQSIGIWQDDPSATPHNWLAYSAANSTPGAVNPPPSPLHTTVPDGAMLGVDLANLNAAALPPANLSAASQPPINPSVALGWSGLDGQFKYELQVDNDADFGSPLVDEVLAAPNWSGPLGEGLFHWRVRIVDLRGKHGAFAGPYKFALVDLGKVLQLGTVKTLLQPGEYKIQHKDSPLLDIGGGAGNVVGAGNAGDRRYPKDKNWDAEHVDANNVPRFGWNGIDNWYCVRASTAMLNDFYGGSLTQDRISLYAFEQINSNWYGNPANLQGKPENDLGFGIGIGSYGTQEAVLSWALGGAPVTPTQYCPPNPNDGNPYTCPNPGGSPMSFADIKSLIDAGRPFMSINLRNAHARVVDGYWDIAPNQHWVHLIDPVPADTSGCPTCTNAQWIDYTTFTNNQERTLVAPANVPNARADEASIHQDSDGDGISDYDEINRFHTDPHNADTDGDWVNDKNDMAEYIFDVSNAGTYVYTPGMKPKTADYDGDGKRKELDWDNDNDGVPDGCEDTNQDGEFDGAAAGETSNFNPNSKQVCQPRFGIVHPLTGQAENAGDPANPDRVLIRLSVALPPALPNPPAFASSQFSVTIGGLAASVVSGAQVGQEYWLLVQAPPQASSSFFDLRVDFAGALTGHKDQTDTEANAIYYIPRPRLDSMVVLDTSGSMADANKLGSAQNAARLYIDQFAENDRIGVVTFADAPNVGLPLTTVQANAQALADAKNVVNGTVANGATAMGPGLLAGQQQLATNGGSDHNWSMMLLTDGQENVTPYWNDPAVSGVIIPSKTVVNTIGIGQPTATWFGLLQQIAGATGGLFGAVDDPSVVMAANAVANGANGVDAAQSANAAQGVDAVDATFPTSTANRLADSYKYAAEQLLDEQRIFDAAGTVVTPGCATYRFNVDAVPSVLFTANFAVPNQARLDVFRPDNSKVAAADVGVTQRVDPTHEQYRVAAPAAGLWHVNICPVANPTGVATTEYVFFASAHTPLTLDLVLGAAVPRLAGTGAPVADAPVLAFLADKQPVLGAGVQMNVLLPNGESVGPVTMLDDGQHGDGAANDGVYGATLTMAQPGGYLVKVKATVPGAGAAYRYAQGTVKY